MRRGEGACALQQRRTGRGSGCNCNSALPTNNKPPPVPHARRTCDSDTALICSSATAADPKGLNADSFMLLPKRAMSVTVCCTASTEAISSMAVTSNRPKPEALSKSRKVVIPDRFHRCMN
jgi:hypothetical protein